MKITIYELLRLIKDNKHPKKIKYCGHIYEWEDYWYLTKTKNGKVCLGGVQDEINQLFHAFDENVEIIEEEKDIEELDKSITSQNYMISNENAPMKERMELVRKLIYDNRIEINIVKDKINELIKAVNELKKDQN